MTPVPAYGARTLVLAALAAIAGCTHTVQVNPIKVEPIDITLHVYLEADKKLDSFFSDIDKPATPPATPGGTQGAP